MAKKMFEIRWHARGGQGAKTASQMLAQAVLVEGKYSQGYPEYGPERSGAPMAAYNRIGDEPINVHCRIENPDLVVVLDDTLLERVNVTDGLLDDGILLVNTTKSHKEIREITKFKGKALYTVDATKIALETIKQPIPNTPMMGALAKVCNVVKLETLEHDFKEKFAKKFKKEVLEGNIQAMKRAYEEVKSDA